MKFNIFETKWVKEFHRHHDTFAFMYVYKKYSYNHCIWIYGVLHTLILVIYKYNTAKQKYVFNLTQQKYTFIFSNYQLIINLF